MTLLGVQTPDFMSKARGDIEIPPSSKGFLRARGEGIGRVSSVGDLNCFSGVYPLGLE